MADKERNDETPSHGAETIPLTAAAPPGANDAAALRALPDEALLKLAGEAADAARYLDLARRTQADFDNYQKRMEQRRRDEARYAIVPFVRELLPTVDNLGRALESSERSRDFDALYKGVGLTFQMLEQSLEKYGVTPVDPRGDSFSPEFHEAVMTGAQEDVEDNIVLEVFEKGWRLHERVIRPAKVKVNKRAGS